MSEEVWTMNQAELNFIILMSLMWLIVVCAGALIPYYIRKTIAFGIAVPEGEYKKSFLTKQRRAYMISSLICGAIFAVIGSLGCFFLSSAVAVWIQMAALCVYLIFELLIYIFFHHKVKKYKQESGWEIESGTAASGVAAEEKDSPFKFWWYILYAVVIVATVAVVWVKYPSLPESIPMHYNSAGEVNRYADKSIGTLMLMPIMQGMLGLLFTLIAVAINTSKRQGNIEKNRIFRKAMGKMIFGIGLLTLLLLSSIEFTMMGMIPSTFTFPITTLFLVVIMAICIYYAVRIGQGGSRIKDSATEVQGNVAQDDAYWKLGVFYINRKDPSFFVEKRFGMGYTINFGNPLGILAVVLLILFCVALIVLPLVIH